MQDWGLKKFLYQQSSWEMEQITRIYIKGAGNIKTFNKILELQEWETYE